jgi:hypothetical protein
MGIVEPYVSPCAFRNETMEDAEILLEMFFQLGLVLLWGVGRRWSCALSVGNLILRLRAEFFASPSKAFVYFLAKLSNFLQRF